jgi:pyrroline-5-carboxylate reductase
MIVNKTIGFIGGGRIVRIFLEGFERGRVQFKRVMVSDINPAVCQKQ